MKNDPHKQDTVAKLQNFGNLALVQLVNTDYKPAYNWYNCYI